MSESQNIYDNADFFEGYRRLREQENCYNNLLEQPAIKNLLPDVTGMSILDLGCGYGDNCYDFIRRGAAKVIGIDLSERMLEIAQRQNADSKVEYHHLDMNDLHKITGKFDLVFSSLAVHYVKDLNRLLQNIHRLLGNRGRLIFSQEHPLTTAPLAGPEWMNKENSETAFYLLSHYLCSGERAITWFVEGVRKYHRSISEIFNTLINTGFSIEQVVEPQPNDQALSLNSQMAKEYHKPSFLLIKASRSSEILQKNRNELEHASRV